MKKLVLSTVLMAGLSANLYAQGTISFDNTGGGLIYVGAGNANPIAVNVNGELLGGSPLTSLASLYGANALTPIDFGVVSDPSGLSYQVPGTPVGTTASLQVRLWDGAFTSYAAAVAGGAAVADSGLFSNPTGGQGAPPALPSTLTGMPAMHLVSGTVPEPSTLALAGLGAAALLMYRRRKN